MHSTRAKQAKTANKPKGGEGGGEKKKKETTKRSTPGKRLQPDEIHALLRAERKKKNTDERKSKTATIGGCVRRIADCQKKKTHKQKKGENERTDRSTQ